MGSIPASVECASLLDDLEVYGFVVSGLTEREDRRPHRSSDELTNHSRSWPWASTFVRSQVNRKTAGFVSRGGVPPLRWTPCPPKRGRSRASSRRPSRSAEQDSKRTRRRRMPAPPQPHGTPRTESLNT